MVRFKENRWVPQQKRYKYNNENKDTRPNGNVYDRYYILYTIMYYNKK